MDKNSVMKRAEKDKVHFINLQFSDIMGAVKNVTISVEQLPEALEKGIWFDGSSIEGFTRIHESDMYLVPDVNTYAVIPWLEGDKKSCRFICDVYTPDGRPFEGDPRYILKKVLKEAEDMGYVFNTGPELEFFLFKKENGHIDTTPHDKGSYFDLVMDKAYDVRRDMVVALQKMGITVETSHHEVAAGQHEIDFRYGDALTTADSAVTFKSTLKAIAVQHGLYVSFMPKPVSGINGSGMHVHQSLFDKTTGENLFFDSSDDFKLSELAKQFVAGQLKYVKEFAAITNPIVNSYKRLVPGYEAATYICWAQVNRSALIRIPRISEGRSKAARVEIRCPDPASNPYLAFAVLLKAGLDGIKQKMIPPKPVGANVFEFSDELLKEKGIEFLPYSLWQAVSEMKKGDFVKSVLGEHTCKKYIDAKTIEWDDFRINVTDWELKRYMETV